MGVGYQRQIVPAKPFRAKRLCYRNGSYKIILSCNFLGALNLGVVGIVHENPSQSWQSCTEYARMS